MNWINNDCWSTYDYDEILDSSSHKLWLFIQKHGTITEKNKIIENITGLNKNQIWQLSSIHLLLSKEVQDLVEVIAPNILRKIAKSTRQHTGIERGRIKGKVNWSKTYIKQQTEKDPSLFVCVSRSPIFDLIENKVLLYCLTYIFQIGQKVLDKEIEVNDAVSIEYISQQDKWMKKIQYIIQECQKLLKNPLFRNIKELHGINQLHIEKTRMARGEHYYRLAQIANLISLQIKKTIEFLYDVFSKQILRPLSRDTLFEIAVAFQIIDTFLLNGWKEKRYSLIGEGQKILCVLEKNDCTLNIYYQQIPDLFIVESKYKELMKDAQLSTHHRRPDIMLEWIDKDYRKRYTIVEVKRSQNKGYLADGVYKVLGYLKDFEIPMQPSSHSMGLLVGWKIENLKRPTPKKEVYTTDWNMLSLFTEQLANNMEDFLD